MGAIIVYTTVDALTLDPDVWTPLVGETFTATGDDGDPLVLVLSGCAVNDHASAQQWASETGRAPFALRFHAPGGALRPQQTFVVRHAERGELALFLVPLGPDERGMCYEAIVS